jgi:hypothetical protein
MIAALICSLLFNIALLAVIVHISAGPQTNHRRGYISTTAIGKSTYDGSKRTFSIRALVEEIENLGTRSRVRYLELTGIDKEYHEEAEQVMGTIIDHDRIEWIKPTPVE